MFDFSSLIDLPLIWYLLILTAVLLYVVLDGFDLGLGILFPLAPTDQCRDRMMNSVAPFWDGNETWLVLGGGGLLAAFPLAYAILMPALYLPVILMLLGLIFRGVAFEFRFKAQRSRPIWDWSFHLGSLTAAFMQGMIVGALIQGVTVVERGFAGGPMDWATPFTFTTGVGLVFGYALLGATWTVMKTEGETQAWARRGAVWLLGLAGVSLAAVTIAIPAGHSQIGQMWDSRPGVYLLAAVPAVAFLLLVVAWMDLRAGREARPFLLVIGFFVAGYLALGLTLWPWIVPYAVTFRQAAAAGPSQSLLLVGTLILLPVILGYTAFSYYLFRGKASHAHEGAY
ncbi:MAG: cytochrome d ubiquinol oxidase subunit II [Desulfobacteraceae bacterium]|nr:cytochrome d ubiquinol oxidase subunit II [Desulfobacteraceae bacterium]